MNKIKIMGGSSTEGRIRIQSGDFQSSAWLEKNGTISCEVHVLPKIFRSLYKNDNLPIPRIIRLLLFIFD